MDIARSVWLAKRQTIIGSLELSYCNPSEERRVSWKKGANCLSGGDAGMGENLRINPELVIFEL